MNCRISIRTTLKNVADLQQGSLSCCFRHLRPIPIRIKGNNVSKVNENIGNSMITNLAANLPTYKKTIEFRKVYR